MPRLAVGNWKMNTTRDDAVALAQAVVAGVQGKTLGDLIVGVGAYGSLSV